MALEHRHGLGGPQARGGVPGQGSNARPLRWQGGSLTTGPPGKSLRLVFKTAD